MQVDIFLLIEIKFFLRNARTRKLLNGLICAAVFWISMISLSGLNSTLEKYLMIMTLISLTPFYFSQLFFSWQLRFLPNYFVLPVNILGYLIARILVIMILTLAGSIMPLVYFWNTPDIAYVAATFFYMAVTIPLIMLLKGGAGARKMDPNKTGVFSNFTGITRYHFLSELVLFGLPLLMYGLELIYSAAGWMLVYLLAVGFIALCLLPFRLLYMARKLTWKYKLMLIN